MLLRAAAAARLPLFDDEAYYWLWNLRLDWGYLDHPPLIAWLIHLGTRVADMPLWIRAVPWLCGVATGYVLFLFVRDLFGVRAALIATLLGQGTVAVAGASTLATPDAPLLLAWVLTARAVWRAARGDRGWWSIAGGGLGLGLLSKLSILWLLAGLACFLAIAARDRLRTAGPYIAVAIGGILDTPFLIWNATHRWSTIRFTLTERPVHLPPGPGAVADLLGAQFIFTLTLFPVFAWALWAAWHRRTDRRFAYLFWAALPAVAVPLALALTTGTHRSYWMAPAYLMLTGVVAALWNRTAAVAAGIACASVAVACILILLPGAPPVPGSEQLYGWDRAGLRAASELAGLPPPALLVSDRYQAAAQLAYATRARVPVTLLPDADSDSIWTQLWGPSARWWGRDAVAVVDPAWPSPDWRGYARRVSELSPLVVAVGPRPARTFRFYRLEGLRPRGR